MKATFLNGNDQYRAITEEGYEAYKIAYYQKYMNDEELPKFFDGVMKKNASANGLDASSYQYEWKKETDTEKYVSMILANEKATRQTNGTYLTKTSEEWKEIYAQMEEELRSMPQESLIAQGQALEKKLQERYNELVADREEMHQSTNVDWSKATKMGIKNSKDNLER